MTELEERKKALELLPQFRGLTINEIIAVLHWIRAYAQDYQRFEISNALLSHQEEIKSSHDSV
ncbi:hypothetical protein BKG93_00175 [Rodentibacter ratti]|uniref:Uncharacterized protein n=1 Tax=Rodentibacter ratti TaxID=1906745 RepID=A0A1V3LES4_9PAST|nr:hypothetical protein [Rodentibacter ratti]OOF88053.1 hypothetical protein BKG93_00175 [Rodentibacter ratti]